MDTDVVEQSGTSTSFGGEQTTAGETLAGEVEATIDEVDHLLDEVEAALTRLDEGTYGACGICGTAIDDASLSTDPTARTCAACDGVVGSSDERAGDEAAEDREYVGDEATSNTRPTLPRLFRHAPRAEPAQTPGVVMARQSSSGGRGWRNSRAAFPDASWRSSAGGSPANVAARTAWVSGQVESAWG